jgi:hypothetical protein
MVRSYFRESVLLASNPVEECAPTFLYFPSSSSRSEVLLWGQNVGPLVVGAAFAIAGLAIPFVCSQG